MLPQRPVRFHRALLFGGACLTLLPEEAAAQDAAVPPAQLLAQSSSKAPPLDPQEPEAPPKSDPEAAHDGHDEHHEHHEHRDATQSGHSHSHRFALGVSVGPTYLVVEKEFTTALHTHFLVTLGKSRFALGVGYERLFDDHQHNAWGIVLQYRIIDPWTVLIAPGITYGGSAISDAEPTVHLETAYEFEFGPIDLGPAFEVAFEPNDVHMTLALHLDLHF